MTVFIIILFTECLCMHIISIIILYINVWHVLYVRTFVQLNIAEHSRARTHIYTLDYMNNVRRYVNTYINYT